MKNEAHAYSNMMYLNLWIWPKENFNFLVAREKILEGDMRQGRRNAVFKQNLE